MADHPGARRAAGRPSAQLLGGQGAQAGDVQFGEGEPAPGGEAFGAVVQPPDWRQVGEDLGPAQGLAAHQDRFGHVLPDHGQETAHCPAVLALMDHGQGDEDQIVASPRQPGETALIDRRHRHHRRSVDRQALAGGQHGLERFAVGEEAHRYAGDVAGDGAFGDIGRLGGGDRGAGEGLAHHREIGGHDQNASGCWRARAGRVCHLGILLVPPSVNPASRPDRSKVAGSGWRRKSCPSRRRVSNRLHFARRPSFPSMRPKSARPPLVRWGELRFISPRSSRGSDVAKQGG